MAATTKKKTSSNRKTATKPSTRGKSTSSARSGRAVVSSKKNAAPINDGIHQEVISLFILLFCVFMFLCMCGAIKGAIGPSLNAIFKGLFGSFGFVLPFIIGTLVVLNYLKTYIFKDPLHPVKKVSLVVVLLSVGIIWSFLGGTDIALICKDSDFIKQLYTKGQGGGVIFGFFACLLCRGLGKAGSIVLSILFAIICLVVVTEKSFIRLLQRGGASIGDYVNKTHEYDNPEAEEAYLEERRRLKEEKRRLKEERRLRAAEEEARAEEEYELRRQKLKEEKQRREEELAKKRERSDDERIVNSNRPLSDTGRKLYNVGSSFGNDTASASTKQSRDEVHDIQVDINFEPVQEGIEEAHAVSAFPTALSYENHHRSSGEMEELVLPEDIQTDAAIPVYEEEKTGNIPEKEEAKANHFTYEEELIPTAMQADEAPIASVIEERFDSNKEADSILYEDMPEPVTSKTHEEIAKLEEASNPVPVPAKPKKTSFKYKKPSIDLLKENLHKHGGDSNQSLKETAFKLQETLKTFGVSVTVSDISQGPSVTRYELTLGEGVKVNKIVALTDDIKLQLAAQDVRIEAPIPGKAAVGIELPNKEASPVLIRDLIENREFKKAESPISFGVGEDISGKVIIGDIAKMPHMLIAGSTGSGKSVCINTLIMSILYNATPDEVKLIMIDPKVVELSVYNGIPHNLIPVVTDPKKANQALMWAVREMEKRYKAFAHVGCRDLKGFNEKLLAGDARALEAADEYGYAKDKRVPLIVVIVDELADLMMTAAKEVEESICRLAQLARAAGIHLVIATQRPSVDVITGLIKANMPSRIAFRVSSGVDSRTILDMTGAERLLGKGDMLFYPQGYPKPLRVQGAFVSDGEVEKVVDYLRSQVDASELYDQSIVESIENVGSASGNAGASPDNDGNGYDELIKEAAKYVTDSKKASAGGLQRVYRIGFNRAARILDQLCELGVVGPENGTKPRDILCESYQLDGIFEAHKI